MGRAGGGSGSSGGGGGHSFSGGHNYGTSSGGHSFGSSGSSGGTGRAGGGSGSSFDAGDAIRTFNRVSRMSGMGNGFGSGGDSFFGGGYGRSVRNSYLRRNRGSALLSNLILIVVIVLVLNALFGGGDSKVKSTIERKKIDNPNKYVTTNIIDELGYFGNTKKGSEQLKEFYDETGVQPYVYIKDYDPELDTTAEKVEYTQEWYDANIGDDYGFAFVYFANADEHSNIPDSQKTVGYMAYAAGPMVGTVMDDEAISIFWGYIDKYWISNLGMEDMMGTVFSGTADSIMKVSKTSGQIIGIVVAVIVGVIALFIVYKLIKERNRREAEKAAETERILGSELSKFSETEEDENLQKYSRMKK